MGERTLKSQVHDEMTAALKAGDKVRLGALRMLVASITNREKEVGHELSDDEVREVAGKEVKRRAESIEAFDAAGRTELADHEREERVVLSAFAPEQLSEAEVEAIVAEAIASTGASSPQEMGAVMGAVMAKAKGRVDGKAVQQMVRERLSGTEATG
ncbi:MAG TPA: GatB/YqeY domain-containing protein [Actinomycetota bacterium]